MGKKWDLSDFEHGMVVGVFQKLLIYWDFHAHPFTENGPKKRKYPVISSCVDEKNLVGVRGEWSDWLEMIEWQQ